MPEVLAPSLLRRVFGGRQSSSFGPSGLGSSFDDDTGALLRAEALQHSSEGAFGQPVAQMPMSWTFLTTVLIAAVAAAAILLGLNSYARKETVRGILMPASGEVQVTAPDRGVIRRIYVNEGDVVRAGQILLTVSMDRPEAGGRIPQADMLQSLDDQERSIRARLAATTSDGSLDDQAAVAQRAMLTASLTAAKADKTAADSQLAMAQDDYDRALPIAQRGFISRTDLKRREQAVIVGKQAVADSTGQIANFTAQLAQLRSTAAKRPYDTIKERGMLEDTLADIRQRRAQLLMSRGYSLRAPVDGRVTTVQANLGQSADPQRPLMSIVPVKAAMQAVLYIPSRSIGFLKRGQAVRMRYDAFPFAAFGAGSGHVVRISQTVLRPEEINAAVRLEEPAYKVVASIDRQDVAAFGQRHSLLPGMALSADIVLERRSFMAWLMQPLLAAKGSM